MEVAQSIGLGPQNPPFHSFKGNDGRKDSRLIDFDRMVWPNVIWRLQIGEGVIGFADNSILKAKAQESCRTIYLATCPATCPETSKMDGKASCRANRRTLLNLRRWGGNPLINQQRVSNFSAVPLFCTVLHIYDYNNNGPKPSLHPGSPPTPSLRFFK